MTEKKASKSKASKQPEPPSKAKANTKLKQAALYGAKTLAKLSFALLLALVVYLIYLDSKVTRKFESKKWQIPAQIYARPMTLHSGYGIDKNGLIAQLEALDYRRVTKLSGPGEYTVSPKHLSVVKRAFDFPGKVEPERWLTIEFDNGRLSRLIDRDSHQPIVAVTFEPLLIDRLLSPHHEDREFMPLERFPELFKDTLLLVEDRDFYHHSGVSITAILRALWHNIRAGRTVQGGSTLTQQLAKNVYLNADRSYIRKLNEAFIALLLDHRYSKDQLLEAYVNEVFLGQFHNRAIHGFGLAARYYFSKPINELSADEFAVLVGIIKGPSYYNPHKHTERALERRDVVLRLMFEHHLLTKQEYEVAVNRPLGIADKDTFLSARFPAYMAQVKKELKANLRDSDIVGDGIRVFTHLDPRLQWATERVVQDYLPKLEASHQLSDAEVASVSVDYTQGAITAMVGGRNVNYSGLNRAVDMRRNIGSLIKPAVYLTALSQYDDFTLATVLPDAPVTLENQNGEQWTPENFDKTHEGEVLLYDALTRSRNIPTVNLGLALGMDSVAESLGKLGVKRRFARYPSLFLGALELSPLEVSEMYATYASKGVYKKLSTISVVTANDGTMIWHRQPSARANFEVEPVYLLNTVLEDVTRVGTARYLTSEFPQVQFAGKTGTTDELRDSWFSGFDGKTLTTFWLGKDDYSPVGLTGSAGALRLFAELNRQVPPESLIDAPPKGITQRFFSAKDGVMYPGQCAGAIVLSAVEKGRPQMVDCPN